MVSYAPARLASAEADAVRGGPEDGAERSICPVGGRRRGADEESASEAALLETGKGNGRDLLEGSSSPREAVAEEEGVREGPGAPRRLRCPKTVPGFAPVPEPAPAPR